MLAVAALAVGVARRPYDAGVVFPVALIGALLVIVVRGQISADDVGRMLTALAVFAAAGAAVAVATHTAGCRARIARGRRGRGGAAGGGALARGRRARRRRPGAPGARAREIVAPALERESPAGYVALPRQWQGQLALAWDRPRGTFIPARAIEEGTRYDKCEVGALIVPVGRPAAALDPPGRRSRTTGARASAPALHQVSGAGPGRPLCTLRA